MGRIFKYLLYLLVIAFLGLVGYAYIGPYVGVDFSAPQDEVRKPVTLEID